MSSIHVYHPSAEDAPHELLDALARALPDRRLVTCDAATLAAEIDDVEVLLAPLPPRTGLAHARRLRFVQTMGAGVDGFLPGADLPERVVIASARGVFAQEVAEHAIAAMLALVRGIPAIVDNQRARRFQRFRAGTLAGRTVVLLGVGAIGGRVARVAEAIGMHVLGVVQSPRPIAHVAEVVGPERLHEALARAEWLVIALPHTPATASLVDARAIAALPDGAFVVNVGRGEVVDEPSLLAALREGRVGGAALDVFAEEPLPETSPWWDAPNVLVTPHLAGLGREPWRRIVERFADNLGRLARGEEVLGRVDRARGY